MAIALFGGTFNPVHTGHLRVATELAELLHVRSVRMMPCAFPPHRGAPQASAQQRLDMLNAAIANQSLLVADDLELQRTEPSYSIDTLELVRQQIGAVQPLFFCIGMDALAKIDTWQRWRELLGHCHIVVSSRPETERPKTGAVAEWIDAHRCDDLAILQQSPAGKVHFCEMTMLDLSSTEIRRKLARGENIQFMTPDAVVNYIQQHHLYE
ncbi:MAG: nicotinate-nucleotide adenylyltransferase [Porticoccaceae bacterium]|jgi:nicotinate-nucleotide adenylyltransferase|nr:nicotinate-nucleotide adenylyltransferase [Porticoccaceae bacterium]